MIRVVVGMFVFAIALCAWILFKPESDGVQVTRDLPPAGALGPAASGATPAPQPVEATVAPRRSLFNRSLPVPETEADLRLSIIQAVADGRSTEEIKEMIAAAAANGVTTNLDTLIIARDLK